MGAMPRQFDDRLRLLHGPFQAPPLRVCDRATCLYRDCDVVVTSWTAAPISWPRCKRVTGKGHPSLLVDAELLRAIRSEGTATVCHWWGASPHVVRRWRMAFGVGLDNPGTRHLIRAAAQKGADAMRELSVAGRKGVAPTKTIGCHRR
jgi:hypothetical protein